MTVIIASIFKNGHAVSSDGRVLFGDSICSETTDKTFSLYNGEVLGAFTNCMSFDCPEEISSAKSINQHIQEIIPTVRPENIENLLKIIKENLTDRLNCALEPAINQRNLTILITGKQDNIFVLYEMVFTVMNDKIVGEVNYKGLGDSGFSIFHIPKLPENLGEIISNTLTLYGYENKKTVTEAHIKSINLVIKACDKFQYEGKCPVGGEIFVR